MSTLTIRVQDDEKALIQSYANLHGQSIAEIIRTSVLERIEDEFDLRDLNHAMATSDGEFVPFAEIKARYGL